MARTRSENYDDIQRGILTAACAWYASAAGVINGMIGNAVLWVGGPLRIGARVGHRAGRAVPGIR